MAAAQQPWLDDLLIQCRVYFSRELWVGLAPVSPTAPPETAAAAARVKSVRRDFGHVRSRKKRERPQEGKRPLSFLPSITSFRERLGFHSFCFSPLGQWRNLQVTIALCCCAPLEPSILLDCRCCKLAPVPAIDFSRRLANFYIHSPSRRVCPILFLRESRRWGPEEDSRGRTQGRPLFPPPPLASECGHRLSSPLFYSGGKFLL